jgi:hypothetical protein
MMINFSKIYNFGKVFFVVIKNIIFAIEKNQMLCSENEMKT